MADEISEDQERASQEPHTATFRWTVVRLRVNTCLGTSLASPSISASCPATGVLTQVCVAKVTGDSGEWSSHPFTSTPWGKRPLATSVKCHFNCMSFSPGQSWGFLYQNSSNRLKALCITWHHQENQNAINRTMSFVSKDYRYTRAMQK